jgi:hypothetical protein
VAGENDAQAANGALSSLADSGAVPGQITRVLQCSESLKNGGLAQSEGGSDDSGVGKCPTCIVGSDNSIVIGVTGDESENGLMWGGELRIFRSLDYPIDNMHWDASGPHGSTSIPSWH